MSDQPTDALVLLDARGRGVYDWARLHAGSYALRNVEGLVLGTVARYDVPRQESYWVARVMARDNLPVVEIPLHYRTAIEARMAVEGYLQDEVRSGIELRSEEHVPDRLADAPGKYPLEDAKLLNGIVDPRPSEALAEAGQRVRVALQRWKAAVEAASLATAEVTSRLNLLREEQRRFEKVLKEFNDSLAAAAPR